MCDLGVIDRSLNARAITNSNALAFHSNHVLVIPAYSISLLAQARHIPKPQPPPGHPTVLYLPNHI